MSESNTGFDWFPVLAILVAGGISIIKAMANKSKPQAGVPSRDDSEYQNEYDEETENRSEVVDGYSDSCFNEDKTNNSILGGDYYKMPSEISEKDNTSQDTPEETGEKHFDFDLRQAVISSEILRRPQY